MRSFNAHPYFTPQPLRLATIAAGIACGIGLAVSYLFEAGVSAGSFDPTTQDIFNAVVFLVPAAWFATNALRWLQERLLRPISIYVFGAIALGAIALGAASSFDLWTDPPFALESSLYQSALAGSAIVAGIIAAASAIMRPTPPEDATTTRFGGTMRAINAGAPLTHLKLALATRWLAILGGVAFAAANFVSPTVIPAAVALTCLVRFADTLPSPNAMLRRGAIVAAGAIVALIIVLEGLLFWDGDDGLAYMLIPGFVLLVGAAVLALPNRAELP